MDSETTTKFIKKFYETPRAQEIYTSLRQRSYEAQRANNKVCVEDITDELMLNKVRSRLENKKEINFLLNERDQEVECDEPLCNCDEPTISESLLSEYESKVSEIYSTILQDQKQRELLNWSVKVVNDREIIVEGQRSGDPSDISWKTSVICERISTNVVRSKKGTLYFLLGEINENDMIEKGFSQEIVSMFKYGFPPNWRDIFSKIVLDKLERENIVNVRNEKKTKEKNVTEDITEDMTNRVSSTKEVQSMKDEMTWDTDRSRNKKYSNTKGNELSKARKTSSSNRIRTEDITEDMTNRVSSTKAVHSMKDEMTWDTFRSRNKKYSNTKGNEFAKARKTSLSNRIRTEDITEDMTNRMSDTNVVHSMDDEATWETDRSRRKTYSKGNELSKARVTSFASNGIQTEDITEDMTNRVSSTSVVHSMDDEATWETDKSRSKTYSNTNTRGNELSKGKKTSPASNRLRNRKTKERHSFKIVSESNDEIEVQRSRSGRLICPVLDYWRGQRIATSPCEGEITIIKSNLEEDTRLTLVETSRNNSGSLQNPTISSSAPTSGNNSSGTEWTEDSPKAVSTSSNSTRSFKQRKNAQKVSSVLSSSVARDTVSGKREKTNRLNKKKFENEATTTSDYISESSSVEQGISGKGSSGATKARIGYDETKDVQENPVRETNFDKKNGFRTHPTNRAKPTNTKKRQQHPTETQKQHLKKSKYDTGKLSSKTGTVARKRELREMLEQQDEGYEDDAFEGTPFRNRNVGRKLQHGVSPVYIDSSADDGIHDKDYRTPSSRTPMNRLRPEGPLSTGKSEADIMTPGLLGTVNRDDVDRYVNQLKRRKLRNMQRKKIESHTPLSKKPSNQNTTGGVEYSFNIQSTKIDSEVEENEDYYWSDNE